MKTNESFSARIATFPSTNDSKSKSKSNLSSWNRISSIGLFVWMTIIRPTHGALTATSMPFGEMSAGEFPPLTCNDNLASATCEPWSSQGYSLNDVVTIPCGKCVTWDLPDYTSINFDGLDVQGKLVFPPNTKATIQAPFITVQGELIASNDQPVDSDNINSLQFLLSGNTDNPFFPNAQNSPSCLGSFCNIGKKAFVVAGGRLDITGHQTTCPTWVHLLDVQTDASTIDVTDYPKPPVPNLDLGCTINTIDENFQSASEGIFKSSLGCSDTILSEPDALDPSLTNYFFRVAQRTRTWQGPFINANNFLRDCMIPNQTYLFAAKYRLVPEIEGVQTNCQVNGTDCLSFTLHTMDATEKLSWRNLYDVPPVAYSGDGEWNEIVAMFEFKDTDFDLTNIYQMLYLSGPEAGVAIDIDNVELTLPWESFYPTPPVCANLVVNGDADADDRFPYPFSLFGNVGSHLQVKKETLGDGSINSYFAVTGRETGWTSIVQDIVKGCIKANSLYTFSMKVRVHSPQDVTVRFVIKTYKADPTEQPNYSVETVGNCPPASSASGWVQCERSFLFKQVHEDAPAIGVQFIVDEDDYSDIDYDDINIVLLSPPVNEFILPASVMGCWGAGAEIVQTSHTLKPTDYNKLNITDVFIGDDNLAHVMIEPGVAKPTTAKDDERFAVEVALLSRNIAIEALQDNPTQPLIGGHLVVMHTPQVQFIQGIDLRNMGQQGLIGKYPIHFHMSGDIEGTVISKNTVRQSNQRCIVIHATHNVTIEYNVAFDTFGHCFMLEDGLEQDNHFNYNIGIMTKKTPADGVLSISESDMLASTFWSASPSNYYLGNVAAGGEDTGFWYEFLEFVRGTSVKLDPGYTRNPSSAGFGYHIDNVMHSNEGEGFKLYPNGYFPEERAVFENVRSYRNKGDGVLLHNSKRLGLNNGIFADNRRQVEVDKQADDVTVTNSLLIGFSKLYQLQQEAGNYASHCPAWRPIVGVQLHSFLRYRDSLGYLLSNLTFTNFGEETGCIGSTAIEMDDQSRDGHFDAYSEFRNLTFPSDSPMGEKFSTCALAENPLFKHDLVINDSTGDLNPTGSKIPGSIVSNSTFMTKYTDNCHPMEGSCALYCEGDRSCYRGINFATWETPDYEDVYLEVTDANGIKTEFSGYFEVKMMPVIGGEAPDEFENTVYQRRRYYTAIVPSGEYTMQFVKQGSPYWPQFVEVQWEDEPPCTPYIDDNSTTFIIPPATEAECQNIIRNNGGEMGGYNFWGHSGSGIQVISGNPNDGTTHSGSYAISSVHRTGGWQGMGQYLDTRCLTLGLQYEILVKIRMQDSNGAYVACNPNKSDYNAFDICPRVSLRMRNILGNRIGDGVETNYAYPLASAVLPWSADTWNSLVGHFTVTPTMAEADSVFFFIERGRPGLNIIIDDVYVSPTIYGCQMPIYNADLEAGDTRYWKTIGTSEIGLYSPGYNSLYALRTTSRGEFWASMAQELNKDCLVEGDTWSVSAMILLLDSNDNVYNCNPTLVWGTNGLDYVCPVMTLRVSSGAANTEIEIGTMPSVDENEWNHIFGSFTVTSDMINADSVSIYFRKVVKSVSIVVDDVSMSKNADSQTALISNGDFSGGDLRFFNSYLGGTIDLASPGYNDDYSMMVKGRTSESFGVRYALDSNLLKASSVYKISCQVFLLMEDMLTFFSCNPNDLSGPYRCPALSLRSQNPGSPAFTRMIASGPSNFKPGQWNKFSGTVQFMASELNAQSLLLIIDKAPANVVMMLDDIQIHEPNFTSEAPSSAPSPKQVRDELPSTSPSKAYVQQ